MIKTGDWSISNLVGYLVQVRETLTTEELGRLASTAAFPREGAPLAAPGKKARYCARELYEPTDIFRQLQLPLLDWGHKSKWRSNSEEGWPLSLVELLRIDLVDCQPSCCTGSGCSDSRLWRRW